MLYILFESGSLPQRNEGFSTAGESISTFFSLRNIRSFVRSFVWKISHLVCEAASISIRFVAHTTPATCGRTRECKKTSNRSTLRTKQLARESKAFSVRRFFSLSLSLSLSLQKQGFQPQGTSVLLTRATSECLFALFILLVHVRVVRCPRSAKNSRICLFSFFDFWFEIRLVVSCFVVVFFLRARLNILISCAHFRAENILALLLNRPPFGTS